MMNGDMHNFGDAIWLPLEKGVYFW